MEEKIYTDIDGNEPLTGTALRAIIENSDFLTAWRYVSTHIVKVTLTKYHKTLMKFQLDNEYSLTISGRGLGKSYILNTCYCLTHLLRDRDIRIAVICANTAQSRAFCNELKNKFNEGTIIYEIWGDLKGDTWREDMFFLKRKATWKEASITTGSSTASANLISRHFDVLIIDDIVSQENSQTALSRDKLKSFFYNVVLPLLIKDKTSKYGLIKIIGTHYHNNDLYVHLQETPMFKILKLPALIKNKSVCPEMKSTKDLILLREQMGKIAFAQQYQAKTLRSNSAYFKDEYLQYFKDFSNIEGCIYVHKYNEVIEEYENIKLEVYIAVDLAISQTKNADKTVISVIGVSENKDIYLLDQYGGKHTFKEQQELIEKYYLKYPMALRVGVESVAYQQAMFQELLRNTDLPVVQIKTDKNKETRISVFSAMFENSKVYLNENLKQLDELIDEMFQFPGGRHDDFIDSFTLAYELSLKLRKRPDIQIIRPSVFQY